MAVTAVAQDQYSSIGQVWDLIKDAASEISFWGSRVVRCSNGGLTSLSTLTNKMLDLSHLRDVEDIPMNERIRGVMVLEKLQGFYKATDDPSNVNIITALFFRIREFFGTNGTELYGPRWRIDDWEPERRLLGFTEAQFRQHFPRESLSEMGYILTSGYSEKLYTASFRLLVS